jgi:hypothetical protein
MEVGPSRSTGVTIKSAAEGIAKPWSMKTDVTPLDDTLE